MVWHCLTVLGGRARPHRTIHIFWGRFAELLMQQFKMAPKTGAHCDMQLPHLCTCKQVPQQPGLAWDRARHAATSSRMVNLLDRGDLCCCALDFETGGLPSSFTESPAGLLSTVQTSVRPITHRCVQCQRPCTHTNLYAYENQLVYVGSGRYSQSSHSTRSTVHNWNQNSIICLSIGSCAGTSFQRPLV